jgi:hypothetical protein
MPIILPELGLYLTPSDVESPLAAPAKHLLIHKVCLKLSFHNAHLLELNCLFQR